MPVWLNTYRGKGRGGLFLFGLTHTGEGRGETVPVWLNTFRGKGTGGLCLFGLTHTGEGEGGRRIIGISNGRWGD